MFESDVEEYCIKALEEEGFVYLSEEEQENEREEYSNVVLKDRLEEAVANLNPGLSQDARSDAIRQVLQLPHQNLMENNEAFHTMLTEGVKIEVQKDGEIRGEDVQLIDFGNPSNNDFVACNQFTVCENNLNRRPDVVLLVNGLPLVVIELKNPTDERATVQKAFTQLTNYKNAIPSLFHYNAALVASDGLDAKAGTLTSPWTRFMAWKTADGVRESSSTTPQMETLIKGMLRPDILLDLIRHFTLFEKEKKINPETNVTSIEMIKKMAAYHQYHAVNKAILSTKKASAEKGDRKIGVVWHTQGSGKSLSMVFYAGKIVLEMDNPTIVVVTDRNDLDDQLFDTFVAGKQLIRQEPKQALNKNHLKKILKVAGGGVIFTTIQKFSPEKMESTLERLSDRKNIVVIADEAHRSQYGFGAKTRIKKEEAFTAYGFAKYLRDALPNASFIGFTGTPIEKEDISTRAVFGDHIDIYDMEQSYQDGATVPIFYESRLVRVHLDEDEKHKLDAEVEEITENEESTAAEKAKVKWTQVEAIIGHKERIKSVASDIVKHFEEREVALQGKGMIVAMSRRIAVELYDEICKIRPDWQNTDKMKGALKVVMTSSSSDPENWQPHNTTKEERKSIGNRFKDPDDPLKLVIVRDMWLTGFDVPCLHTMYIDKPMKGHNIMQTIARVNRVYKDKEGGLIVDYVGVASDLKKALEIYRGSGGSGKQTFDQKEAIALMMDKYETVVQMFTNFDYKRYFSSDTREKMTVILEAQEHILGMDKGKDRFIKEVIALSKAFSLSVPSPEAMEIKEELGFFQAIKARLVKFESKGSGKSDAEIETAIRQIVDKAVISEGVMDIFSSAGIKRPDISVFSDDFLDEVRNYKRKNLALELLKKLLRDEIRIKGKKNFIQNKKFSELLDNAIKKYQNNLLTTAQVIEELIILAKKFREEEQKRKAEGLTDYEKAFYDALADNKSAREVLKNDVLKKLACVLVEKVKANTSIDWTIKKNIQARLRVMVKRTLRQYDYPPDMSKLATDKILRQAELFAEDWDS